MCTQYTRQRARGIGNRQASEHEEKESKERQCVWERERECVERMDGREWIRRRRRAKFWKIEPRETKRDREQEREYIRVVHYVSVTRDGKKSNWRPAALADARMGTTAVKYYKHDTLTSDKCRERKGKDYGKVPAWSSQRVSEWVSVRECEQSNRLAEDFLFSIFIFMYFRFYSYYIFRIFIFGKVQSTCQRRRADVMRLSISRALCALAIAP